MKTLHHNLGQDQVCKWTKDELLEGLANTKHGGYARKQMSKQALLDMAMDVLAERKKRHEAEEKAKADQRMVELAREWADKRVQQLVRETYIAVLRHYRSRRAVIRKFRKELSSCHIMGCGHVMAWSGEGLFDAVEVGREIRVMLKYVFKQAIHQTDTTAEMIGLIEESTLSFLRDITEYDDYRHNSTSTMHNIENTSRFRAKQYMYRLGNELVKAMKRSLAKDEPLYLGTCM